MDDIRTNKIIFTILPKTASLVVIPLIGILAQTNRVSAQIIPRSSTATTVDIVGEKFDINGGQVSTDNENLFHSFEQFDLGRGQTANFITDSNIQNVIGNINGGNASIIDGTLQISDSDANLYLMNAAGILFGPDARLNLSGDMTATTASGIVFTNGQVATAESTDYSGFVGEPIGLQFMAEQAGAVVNLGDLAVDTGQSISLIGGTVVNTGGLEAPSGAVTTGAVKGKRWVRFSQENQILSLEVPAAGPSLEITPASISEMLTGSGLSDVTALINDADGTVRLGSTGEVISEEGGRAIASGTLSTTGETGGNINVSGKQVSIETATLDASGTSSDGTIRIDAENIVIADSPISSSNDQTYLPSRYVEGLSSTANVDIAATDNFLIEDLSNDQLRFQQGRTVTLTADSDNDLNGEFIMTDLEDWLDVDRGNLSIFGAGITAGHLTTDTIGQVGEGAGNITAISSRGILIDGISSNTYFGENNAGNGGEIRLEAEAGDITVRNLIKTWSYAGNGNNAGMGGDVVLRASNNITVDTINSVSAAGKNSSGEGGDISLTALTGNVTVTGNIFAGSQAGKNNAGAGGSVVISAGNDIEVAGTIDTSSTANNSNTGDAGLVALTAGNDLLVHSINAVSTGKGDNGNIFLTGNDIDLLGGDRSVAGQSIWFSPASPNQDINIWISAGTDSALNVSEADLTAIREAADVTIGRTDGTGKVSLFSEGIEATNQLFPIHILGGEILAGYNTENYWTIDGPNKGTANDISFENIGTLEGGDREDTFEFAENGMLTGKVEGGAGTDTVDFTNSTASAIGTDLSGIENIVGRIEEEETTIVDNPDTTESNPAEENPVEENSAEGITESNPIIEGTTGSDPVEGTTEISSVSLSIQALKKTGQSLSTIAMSTEQSSGSSSNTASGLQLLSQNGATEIEAIADTFSKVEAGIGGNFRAYLGLSEENESVETVGSVQKTLRAVDETTGVKPALIYAYFVPDAEAESAVVVGSDYSPQANDQLEVMLVTQEGIPVRKRQWGVTREQVEAASQAMREHVTKQFSTPHQYLAPAQQLYDWLIQPIGKELEYRHIESLGFVMDDGLRTTPIAALHDGDRYLVEDYSVGLLPSFSLTKFENAGIENIDFATSRVLAMGASEFEAQPSLPAVDAELSLITQQLWQGETFLNEDFVLENLQNQIKKQDYGIVHLATHASFESGNMENSYIQMWDDRLSLSDVKELGLDSSKVGLIILSACNTALGDRASEYGFAGFAVTAGSQSALASLWPVSDEGTLGFMSQFYTALKQSSVRADALRQAQLNLIRGDVGIDDGLVYGPQSERIADLPELAESGRWDFSHPFYWSAFTMIGNPW